MRKIANALILLNILAMLLGACSPAHAGTFEPDYDLNGTIDENQLRSYLSRTMKMSNMLSLQRDDFEQHLRMAVNCGAKLLQRTIVLWGEEDRFIAEIHDLQPYIQHAHQLDDQLIFQGTLFEFITSDVEKVAIPAFIFSAFGLPTEERHFNFREMLNMNCYDEEQSEVGVPDLNKLEARMWYYYVATLYIDIGCEAIHLGQLEWTAENDLDKGNTYKLLSMIRAYAREHARRGVMLLDAHTHDLHFGDHLLLDFHSYPLRLKDMGDGFAAIDADFYDSIYNQSGGGITPSGWETESLPYVVVFDHGYSQGSRAANSGPEFVDGFDEITWFSRLPFEERNVMLAYLFKEVQSIDSQAYLSMPGISPVYINHEEYPQSWYFSHDPQEYENGFGQENTIKDLWSQ
jgi:hypothetical protein